MVEFLMMSAKLTTLGLLKIDQFGNFSFFHFANFHSISMREVIITSILQGFDQKNQFFEGCCWLEFNNLGLALGMALRFYTISTKGLKLKVRTF